MKQKKKAGFSMTEVVIAMAVVVIVSIAAATAISGAVNIKGNTVRQTAAQNFAANALECYKAVTSDGDPTTANSNYEAYLEFLTGAEITGRDNGQGTYFYTYEENDWRATIRIHYKDGRFHIDIQGKNDTNIISFDYRKGNTGGGL